MRRSRAHRATVWQRAPDDERDRQVRPACADIACRRRACLLQLPRLGRVVPLSRAAGGTVRTVALLAARFWDKVAIDRGCWLWTAGTRHGYGAISEGGRGSPMIMAHRFSWEFHFGPIPDGLGVLHKCDNPPCVNPAHLFLGTQGDNMRDKAVKGRDFARNRGITHCKHGHEFTPENTYIQPHRRRRHCRACRVTSDKRRRLRTSA